jgi:hypothetical protein
MALSGAADLMAYHRDEARPFLRRLLRTAPFAQQLLLILSPRSRVEYGDANDVRPAVRIARERRVYQDGESAQIGANDLHGDLTRATLHQQEGHVMRFIIDPARRRQQIVKAPVTDDLVGPITRPLKKSTVGADDQPGGRGGYIAAGRVLIQIRGDFRG